MKKITLFLATGLGLGFALLTYAATPAVTTFRATQSYVNSNAPIGFSWVVQNGGAAILNINCPSGVKLQAMSGDSNSCNVDQSLGEYGSGGLDLIATNVSGTAKTISATLTPKDASGTSYASLAQTVYVTVGFDPEPITSLALNLSGDSVESFAPVAFTWTSRGTTGMNVMLVCNSSVVASSTSPNVSSLPCDQKAFTNDLAKSGSLTLTFYNSRQDSAKIKLYFWPAMESGVYDGAHGKAVELTIKPYRPDVASVTELSADPTRILSTGSTTVSWLIKNAAGVNLKSTCLSDVTFVVYQDDVRRESSCGQLLFGQALGTIGSTSVKIINGMDVPRTVPLEVLPQMGDGSYDAQLSKTVSVFVEARSAKVLPSLLSSVLPTNPAGQVAPRQVISTYQKAVNAYKFVRYMEKGARGEDVKALQAYLKNFADIYPEGLVTGYFGLASEKAVQRFQLKYGLAKKGDAGYGVVGPKTRAKLNEVQ